MKRFHNGWLLAVVAVCVFSLWLGRGAPVPWGDGANHHESSRSSDQNVRLEQGLQVLVLNGTHERGLARNFGMLMGRCGLAPIGYGNAAPQDYEQSFLVNRRLPAGQMTALRDLLGGIPVVQEFDGRETEDAVLVLGADHASLRTRLEMKLP